MELINRIRESLAQINYHQALPIMPMHVTNSAWVISDKDWFGVAVPNPFGILISERFSNVKIWSAIYDIGGEDISLLLLTSNKVELRYEFASICSEFCDLGENNQRRVDLQHNPFSWWATWRNLLGNAVRIKAPYSLLGEMLVLEQLRKKGIEVKWSALEKATHDIESAEASYEVKSTTMRYESTITINSQYQLFNGAKKLYILFCRFEPSDQGLSIDDMCVRLINTGIVASALDESLKEIGFERGCSARSEKYKLHEIRNYLINDDFPKIDSELFIQKKIPNNITRIVYDVDLNGLPYINFDLL